MTQWFNRHHLLSISMLLLLSFSVITHSHDYVDETVLFEQLDCKLCQFQLELPEQKLTLAQVNVGVYQAKTCTAIVRNDKQPCINLSWQRAPPLSS